MKRVQETKKATKLRARQSRYMEELEAGIGEPGGSHCMGGRWSGAAHRATSHQQQGSRREGVPGVQVGRCRSSTTAMCGVE